MRRPYRLGDRVRVSGHPIYPMLKGALGKIILVGRFRCNIHFDNSFMNLVTKKQSHILAIPISSIELLNPGPNHPLTPIFK